MNFIYTSIHSTTHPALTSPLNIYSTSSSVFLYPSSFDFFSIYNSIHYIYNNSYFSFDVGFALSLIPKYTFFKCFNTFNSKKLINFIYFLC